MDIAKIKDAGSRVRTGGWVKDIPVAGFDGVALRVRGINNIDARRLREKLAREAAPKDGGSIPAENLDVINNEVILGAILLDWNLTEDGAPLAFSVAKAGNLLADPDIGPLLRDAVSYAGSVVAEQGTDEMEAAAGN